LKKEKSIKTHKILVMGYDAQKLKKACIAEMVELADTLGLGSSLYKVGVQVPLSVKKNGFFYVSFV
jgi:hypothetical protein